jgi:hypothetical protein
MATIAFDPRMKSGDDVMTVTLTGAVASAEITDDSITSADIKAGEIVNSDLSASAAVAYSKLAALASARLLVGSAANVATDVDVTGDVTISNAGVTAIGAGKVLASMLGETAIQYAEVAITAADIVATGAGKFGHANGYPLVASPGATKVLELLSAVMIYDYATAAYTAGGNITVNISGGGAALTGLISAANSVGAAADKIVGFVPLSTTGIALTKDTGVNLVSSAAFTNPGTAAGVIRVKVAYRVHTHALA